MMHICPPQRHSHPVMPLVVVSTDGRTNDTLEDSETENIGDQLPVYVEIYQRKNSTTVTHGSTFIEKKQL